MAKTKKQLWLEGLQRLFADATAIQSDIAKIDGSDVATQFLLNRPMLDGHLDSCEVEDWPEVWAKDVEAATKRMDELALAGLLLKASALLDAIWETAERRKVRRETIEEQIEKIEGRVDAASDQIDALIPKTPPVPDSVVDLQQRLRSVRTPLAEAKDAWETIGDADRAEKLLDAAYPDAASLYIDAKLHRFEADKTMEFSQGAFKREGSDTTVLGDLDSQGVCLALSCDWLGSGGTGSHDGFVEGKITTRHTRWQVQGTLAGRLVGSMRKQTEVESTKKRSPAGRATERLGPARALLDEILTTKKTLPGEVASLKDELAERKGEIDLQNRGARELGDLDEIIDYDDDDVYPIIKGKLDAATERLSGLDEAILKQKLLIAQLKAVAGSEDDAPEHDGEPVDIDELERRYQKAKSSWEAEDREHKRLYGLKGLVLPSANYNAFGIEPSGEDPKTLGRGGEPLSGAAVSGFMRELIRSVKAGETWGFELGLRIPDGHSAAARVTQPLGEGSPDIELFEPNLGAWRFDDEDDAVACFRSWSEDVYRGSWTSITATKVRQTQVGETTDDLSDSGGDRLSGGTSLTAAWSADSKVLTEVTGKALAFKEIPERYAVEIKHYRARALKLGAHISTEVDLQVAQSAARRAVTLARYVIDGEELCIDAETRIADRVKPKDPRYNAPRQNIVIARQHRVLGEYDEAQARYQLGLNALDLVEGQLMQVHMGDDEPDPDGTPGAPVKVSIPDTIG